ncbi:MAG: flavin monoamine oxidase family protein [Actinomycetota bacterium]
MELDDRERTGGRRRDRRRVAGLTAARDLGERGLTVAVLEGRDRLGGRTWTRRIAGTDVPAEMGGTWFTREKQPAIASEIARYGLDVRAGSPFDRAVWVGTEGRIETADALDAFGPLFAPARAAVDAAVLTLRRAYDDGHAVPGELDVAATEWIDALDVPTPTKEGLLSWMAVVGGGDPAAQSIVVMLGDLATTGISLEASLEELGETFADGTVSFVDALAGDVRGSIELDSSVAGVAQGADLVRVTTTDGRELTGAAVVVALPLNCLDDVTFSPGLPAPLARAAREKQAGRSTKVLTITEAFGAHTVGSAWGHPLQGALGMYDVEGGTLVAGFDGLGRLADPHDAREVEAALEVFAPETRVVAVDSHDWINDPFSKGTWLTTPPGWSSGADTELAAPYGRLAFAGSDIAFDGSGYIEGAIISGREAAQHVAQLLGRDAS